MDKSCSRIYNITDSLTPDAKFTCGDCHTERPFFYMRQPQMWTIERFVPDFLAVAFLSFLSR